MPSLDYLSGEIQTEREAYVRHFDSLDTKAGVLLGFSGILVSLATSLGSPIGALAGLAALLAVVFALFAYVPREAPALDVLHVREQYLAADERFARLHLLDTKIHMIREFAGILSEKALRLRIGLVLLAVSALLLLAGQIGTISQEGSA